LFIATNNPWALHRIVEVLYEARKHGYWSPSEELLGELERVRLEVEQLLRWLLSKPLQKGSPAVNCRNIFGKKSKGGSAELMVNRDKS
jgi:cobalamin biosynthesis Mg chelatase CobN